MAYPSFNAKYSNPAYLVYGTGSSLPTEGQARETQSVDGYFGYRLWSNTEFHFDALLWQGFGVNNTYGIADFPDGEAFKVGVRYPHFAVARFFTRTTINLGGPQQSVEDDLLTLRGKQDTNRITVTIGRMSVKDIFDNNQYSNDPRGQFMNWALMANAAYDYPADALGFTTGIAIEWNRPNWTLRYGWFQMSKYRNQFTAEGLYLVIPTEPLSGDGKIFQDWGMVTELEHRHTLATHPGAVRLLVFDDRMNNGSYKAAVALANDPATLAIWGTAAAFLASANGVTGGIDDTHALRNTWGIGLNADQEITKNLGAFSRIGWNSGQNSGFEFTDTNWTATFGASIKGEQWKPARRRHRRSLHHQRHFQGESGLPRRRRHRHPHRRRRSQLRPREKRRDSTTTTNSRSTSTPPWTTNSWTTPPTTKIAARSPPSSVSACISSARSTQPLGRYHPPSQHHP